MNQVPLFLFISLLGCLFPAVAKAFVIVWLLVIILRLL
jgi:hypothetical protein